MQPLSSHSVTSTYPLLTHCVSVRGGLHASFQFTSLAAAQAWIEAELPRLCARYGESTGTISELDPLSVGDTCYVSGEGYDSFVIKSVVEYSPHSYGFVLDSGCTESVSKCSPLHPALWDASPEVRDLHRQLASLISTPPAPPTPHKKQKKIGYLVEYDMRVPDPFDPRAYHVVHHQSVFAKNPRQQLKTAPNLQIEPIFHGQTCPLSWMASSDQVHYVLTQMLSSLLHDRLAAPSANLLQALDSAPSCFDALKNPLGLVFFSALSDLALFDAGAPHPSNIPAVARAVLEKLRTLSAWQPLLSLVSEPFDFQAAYDQLRTAQLAAYDADCREALS